MPCVISIEDFASKLQGVKRFGNEYSALCPAHNDRKQSLSFCEGDDGKILFECHTGCDKQEILGKMGLAWKDVNPPKRKPRESEPQFDFNNVVAEYVYRNGTRKLRDRNKNFFWQHMEKGEWKPKRGDAPHVLFIFGEPSEVVYLCEGEKDVLNFSKLGFYCACSEHGADRNGKNKWYTEYTNELAGKEIRILMDNDETGHKYSECVANQLDGVVKSVKLLDLSSVWTEMKEHQDISDMLHALGKDETLELVSKLENNTPTWHRSNVDEVRAMLETSREKPTSTSQNFLTIFRNDKHFCDVRFNMLRCAPERTNGEKRVLWSDLEDSRTRNYIEREYHLTGKDKCNDAFMEFAHEHEYHPVQELLNSIQWDGVSRCEAFLSEWAGAENTPYTREVSRLIFAGGIARAYSMGCKFEDVPVLIGAQGGGKSTLCRWLAMNDDFFATIKTISGQKGSENWQGKWICELEELLAVLANDKAGTKMDDNVKAFLSEQSAYYRTPYERRSSDHKRGCIFIGTTNRDEFLTDKTGNRRWYPIRCKMKASDLYAREKECRAYIAQCWAEMRTARENGDALANPYAKPEMAELFRKEQADAECEDSMVGVIEYYLDSNDKAVTCVRELWIFALNHRDGETIPKSESNSIANILVHQLGWERWKIPVDFKIVNGVAIGKQRAFFKPSNDEKIEQLPF